MLNVRLRVKKRMKKKKELEVDVVKNKTNDRYMHILPRNQQKTVGIKSIKKQMKKAVKL